MKMKGIRFASLILAMLFILQMTAFAQNKAADAGSFDTSFLFAGGETDKPDYQKISETNKLALYADMKTGLFKLENKNSGKMWYSTPEDVSSDTITKGTLRSDIQSQLIVNYVTKSEEASSTVTKSVNSNSCVSSGKVKVEKDDQGICVTYTFSEIDTTIPVSFFLKDDSFFAEVGIDKIDEGKDVYLTSVSLLPFFGAGNSTDSGYLFVPDGSGAVIRFNNGVDTSTAYDRLLYGEEPALSPQMRTDKTQPLLMPVFGIVDGNEALMGTVAEGDSMASILAFKGNSRCGYNSVSSKVNLRFLFSSVAYEDNETNKYSITRASRNKITLPTYSVKYDVLSGDSANIFGMAKNYRTYLGLDDKSYDDVSSPVLNINFLGSVEKQAAFLGIPYRKQVSLTTFNQAQSIISDLQGKGVDSLSVSFAGFYNSGLLNAKVPSSADPLSNLGGKKAYKNFMDFLDTNNISFYPVIEFQQFRKSGNGISIKTDSIKTALGQIAKQYVFLRSIGNIDTDADEMMLLAPVKLNKVFDRLYKSCKANNMDNISFTTLASKLYSDFDSKDGSYRNDTKDEYIKILNEVSADGKSIRLSATSAYAIPYADKITDTPLCSSGYDIFDYDVPFYEAVLHGRIALTSEPVMQSDVPQVTVLEAIENGCELNYNAIYKNEFSLADTTINAIYSATSELWTEDAVSLFKAYQPVLKIIYNQKMINNYEVANGVKKTVYENGTRVYVNYNNYDVTVDGVTIAADSFESR